MIQAQINYWAVLVSALATMIIGAIWYSPRALGNQWMSLIGKTSVDLKNAATGLMYLKTFIASLLMIYILAHFVDYASATTVGQGIVTGVWVWLGFVATTMFINIIYENRPLKLWLINAGYQLVVLVVAGAILAAWA